MIGTQHTCNMPITLSILSLCDYYILCISYIICITCAINWKCSLYIQGGIVEIYSIKIQTLNLKAAISQNLIDSLDWCFCT